MTSPPLLPVEDLSPPPAVETKLSFLIHDLSQNVQVAMEDMLKMTNEIDQTSASITEEIEKFKDSVLQRKMKLEEEKDRFQKAAFAVLDMLNSRSTD